jgi:hypothetical protein
VPECDEPRELRSAEDVPRSQGPREAKVLAAAPSNGQGQSGGSLADRLKAVQSGQADKVATTPLPAWRPFQSGATAPTITLGKGLVVVTAVSTDQGDYESIKSHPGCFCDSCSPDA